MTKYKTWIDLWLLLLFIISDLLVILSSWGHAAEFIEESEKDYPLRSMLQLEVTNAKGDIQIQGWALDKIRVQVKKKVSAESRERADQIFSGLGYRFDMNDQRIEISNQYGKNLSIQERVEQTNTKAGQVDFIISAPSNLKMRIWGIDGTISVKGWNAESEIRSGSGAIQLDTMKAPQLSVTCSQCSLNLKNIRANVRCITEDGDIQLKNIRGKTVFADSSLGALKLSDIEGNQLYVSKSGKIMGESLKGKIEFQALNANIELKDISGFLSGSSEDGTITASIHEWKFAEKALIETRKGNISLTMPHDFSSEVDIWSIYGKVDVRFPLFHDRETTKIYGPEPVNQKRGRVNQGGELFKVFSQSGDILVTKGEF